MIGIVPSNRHAFFAIDKAYHKSIVPSPGVVVVYFEAWALIYLPNKISIDACLLQCYFQIMPRSPSWDMILRYNLILLMSNVNPTIIKASILWIFQNGGLFYTLLDSFF